MDLVGRKVELLRLRSDCQKEVTSLMRSDSVETAKDLGEQFARDEADIKRLRTLDAASGRLCGMDRALRLIGQGWNGTCIDCGEPISDARIRALPWATRCTECAEKAQKSMRGTVTRSAARFRPPIQKTGVVAS